MTLVEALLGGTMPSFIGMTIVLFGAAAALTGQALARNWRAARGSSCPTRCCSLPETGSCSMLCSARSFFPSPAL